MGDIADYYREQEINDEFYRERKIIRSSNWLQRNGEYIRIKDMHSLHIANTINMLERYDGYDDWIIAFKRELKRREVKFSWNSK
jgi:hypothetical protein